MPTIEQLEQCLAQLAPLELAEPWDNSGTLVRFDDPVTGVLCALDITAEVVREAIETGCNVIVAHHPIIFAPLKRIDESDIVAQLIQARISAICLHTCLDSAQGGINDTLAIMFKVRRPVAFVPYGRVGKLKEPCTVAQLAQKAKLLLGAQGVYTAISPDQIVTTLAIVSGSGGDCIADARAAGADCLLTGEVKYHDALDALAIGFPVVAAGHYETERIVTVILKETIKQTFATLPVFETTQNKTPFVAF